MLVSLGLVLIAGWVAVVPREAFASETVTISNSDPRIWYHGRWDASPGTWWASSGFNLHVQNLSVLTLNLGPHTTSPLTSAGVSVNYGSFYQVNVSQGSNVIPLEPSVSVGSSVVRVDMEGWHDNRMNLESIGLNPGATLLPYVPSRLAFQFIGDSLSAGQYLPQGVDQAWPYLTGEYFTAERVVNAQPGAALTDIYSYGNVHGVSYQFFRTEDTGYYETTDHNYTTPWDFFRDDPQPTHVVIHIGANDAAQNVTGDSFVQTYLEFLGRLRTVYPYQPIFVFTPWGWPDANGTVNYYYPGRHEEVVEVSRARGDENIYLVNTTGWVTWEDVFPTNLHPSIEGHQKIAGLFESWLEDWGLQAEPHWATSVS